jgi:hypothetical protein
MGEVDDAFNRRCCCHGVGEAREGVLKIESLEFGHFFEDGDQFCYGGVEVRVCIMYFEMGKPTEEGGTPTEIALDEFKALQMRSHTIEDVVRENVALVERVVIMLGVGEAERLEVVGIAAYGGEEFFYSGCRGSDMQFSGAGYMF